MNIVICSLNSKYIHSSLAPFCLLAGVREYAHFENSVKICEGTINEKVTDVLKRILEQKPEMLAFSCYIWNIQKVYELIDLVKTEIPNCIITLGGPEVSYNTEVIFKGHKDVDYIISGEGELPFALLCDSFLEPRNIPGLATREYPSVEPYVPTDIPPSPYVDEYFENLNGRIAYLETSRGCPFRCAFCLSGRCGGARFYPIERAKREILLLAQSGAKTIKLVDRTFNANKARAYELFSFIIDNYGETIPKGVCFHFEIAGDLLDRRTIELLRSAPAGSIQLEIGLQSFNPDTLCAVNRKTDLEKLKQNTLLLLERNNMHIHIDLIAGLPYEDLESFKESFNIAFSLRPHMLQLGFLKLLHGADMREYSDKYPCEYSLIPPYEITSTPWLSESDIKTLKLVEDVVDRLYNSGRFKRSIEYILDTLSDAHTPFDIFLSFARYLEDKNANTLDLYTECIFLFFAESTAARSLFSQSMAESASFVDRAVLRDKLVKDRMLTNASGKLPSLLKIPDDRLRLARISLEHDISTKAPKGVKRSVALLYTESKVMCVDYTEKHPVTEEYDAKYYEMDERCKVCRF